MPLQKCDTGNLFELRVSRRASEEEQAPVCITSNSSGFPIDDLGANEDSEVDEECEGLAVRLKEGR